MCSTLYKTYTELLPLRMKAYPIQERIDMILEISECL